MGTTNSVDPGRRDDVNHGYISAKDLFLKRLKRIEGQSRGLQRMVEEEKYCIDILTQISAMTKALQAVAMGLLEDHLSHCVVDAAVTGGPGIGCQDQGGRRRDQATRKFVRTLQL